MRVRSFRWVLPVAMLAYLASSEGGAGAQPGSTPAPASTPGAAGPAGEGTVGFQRKTSLTPQEQLAESAKHLGRMEQAAAGVRKMLEEARKQRDVVKTLSASMTSSPRSTSPSVRAATVVRSCRPP